MVATAIFKILTASFIVFCESRGESFKVKKLVAHTVYNRDFKSIFKTGQYCFSFGTLYSDDIIAAKESIKAAIVASIGKSKVTHFHDKRLKIKPKSWRKQSLVCSVNGMKFYKTKK